MAKRRKEPSETSLSDDSELSDSSLAPLRSCIPTLHDDLEGIKIEDRTLLDPNSSLDSGSSNLSYPSHEPSLLDQLRSSLAQGTDINKILSKKKNRRNMTINFSLTSSLGSANSSANITLPKERRQANVLTRRKKSNMPMDFTMNDTPTSCDDQENESPVLPGKKQVLFKKPVAKKMSLRIDGFSDSDLSRNSIHDDSLPTLGAKTRPIPLKSSLRLRAASDKNMSINISLENSENSDKSIEHASLADGEQSSSVPNDFPNRDDSQPKFDPKNHQPLLRSSRSRPQLDKNMTFDISQDSSIGNEKDQASFNDVDAPSSSISNENDPTGPKVSVLPYNEGISMNSSTNYPVRTDDHATSDAVREGNKSELVNCSDIPARIGDLTFTRHTKGDGNGYSLPESSAELAQYPSGNKQRAVSIQNANGNSCQEVSVENSLTYSISNNSVPINDHTFIVEHASPQQSVSSSARQGTSHSEETKVEIANVEVDSPAPKASIPNPLAPTTTIVSRRKSERLLSEETDVDCVSLTPQKSGLNSTDDGADSVIQLDSTRARSQPEESRTDCVTRSTISKCDEEPSKMQHSNKLKAGKNRFSVNFTLSDTASTDSNTSTPTAILERPAELLLKKKSNNISIPIRPGHVAVDDTLPNTTHADDQEGEAIADETLDYGDSDPQPTISVSSSARQGTSQSEETIVEIADVEVDSPAPKASTPNPSTPTRRTIVSSRKSERLLSEETDVDCISHTAKKSGMNFKDDGTNSVIQLDSMRARSQPEGSRTDCVTRSTISKCDEEPSKMQHSNKLKAGKNRFSVNFTLSDTASTDSNTSTPTAILERPAEPLLKKKSNNISIPIRPGNVTVDNTLPNTTHADDQEGEAIVDETLDYGDSDPQPTQSSSSSHGANNTSISQVVLGKHTNPLTKRLGSNKVSIPYRCDDTVIDGGSPNLSTTDDQRHVAEPQPPNPENLDTEADDGNVTPFLIPSCKFINPLEKKRLERNRLSIPYKLEDTVIESESSNFGKNKGENGITDYVVDDGEYPENINASHSNTEDLVEKVGNSEIAVPEVDSNVTRSSEALSLWCSLDDAPPSLRHHYGSDSFKSSRTISAKPQDPSNASRRMSPSVEEHPDVASPHEGDRSLDGLHLELSLDESLQYSGMDSSSTSVNSKPDTEAKHTKSSLDIDDAEAVKDMNHSKSTRSPNLAKKSPPLLRRSKRGSKNVTAGVDLPGSHGNISNLSGILGKSFKTPLKTKSSLNKMSVALTDETNDSSSVSETNTKAFSGRLITAQNTSALKTILSKSTTMEVEVNSDVATEAVCSTEAPQDQNDLQIHDEVSSKVPTVQEFIREVMKNGGTGETSSTTIDSNSCEGGSGLHKVGHSLSVMESEVTRNSNRKTVSDVATVATLCSTEAPQDQNDMKIHDDVSSEVPTVQEFIREHVKNGGTGETSSRTIDSNTCEGGSGLHKVGHPPSVMESKVPRKSNRKTVSDVATEALCSTEAPQDQNDLQIHDVVSSKVPTVQEFIREPVKNGGTGETSSKTINSNSCEGGSGLHKVGHPPSVMKSEVPQESNHKTVSDVATEAVCSTEAPQDQNDMQIHDDVGFKVPTTQEFIGEAVKNGGTGETSSKTIDSNSFAGASGLHEVGHPPSVMKSEVPQESNHKTVSDVATEAVCSTEAPQDQNDMQIHDDVGFKVPTTQEFIGEAVKNGGTGETSSKTIDSNSFAGASGLHEVGHPPSVMKSEVPRKSKRKSVSFKPPAENLYHSPPDHGSFQYQHQNSDGTTTQVDNGYEFSRIQMTTDITEIEPASAAKRAKRHFSSTPISKPKKPTSPTPDDKHLVPPQPAKHQFLVPPALPAAKRVSIQSVPEIIAPRSEPGTIAADGQRSSESGSGSSSYDLSCENSLDISAIPKDVTGPRWGNMYHSTPLHRTKASMKKLRKKSEHPPVVPQIQDEPIPEEKPEVRAVNHSVQTSRNLRSRSKTSLDSASASEPVSQSASVSLRRSARRNPTPVAPAPQTPQCGGDEPIGDELVIGSPANIIAIQDNTIVSTRIESQSRTRGSRTRSTSGSTFKSYDSHRKMTSRRLFNNVDENKSSTDAGYPTEETESPPRTDVPLTSNDVASTSLQEDGVLLSPAESSIARPYPPSIQQTDENISMISGQQKDDYSDNESVISGTSTGSSSSAPLDNGVVMRQSFQSQLSSLSHRSASHRERAGSHHRPEPPKPRSKFAIQRTVQASDLDLIYPVQAPVRKRKRTYCSAPKLFNPGTKWKKSKQLYAWLKKKLEPDYKLRTNLESERLVIELDRARILVSRGHKHHALDLCVERLKRLKICSDQIQLWGFFMQFMPFDFVREVVPMGGAFGKPFDEDHRVMPDDLI